MKKFFLLALLLLLLSAPAWGGDMYQRVNKAGDALEEISAGEKAVPLPMSLGDTLLPMDLSAWGLGGSTIRSVTLTPDGKIEVVRTFGSGAIYIEGMSHRAFKDIYSAKDGKIILEKTINGWYSPESFERVPEKYQWEEDTPPVKTQSEILYDDESITDWDHEPSLWKEPGR